MDKFIAGFAAVADRDLMLCHEQGVAYQRDMSRPVSYNGAYFDKYTDYEGSTIALRINEGRIGLVQKHYGEGLAIDIGIGSGEFIKRRRNTVGYDVNPKAAEWLRSQGFWRDTLSAFDAFTFWDVIEHVECPNDYFRHMRLGSFLFTSLPIFRTLDSIRESKHYRPNEHFYYWTERGLVDWMGLYGFDLLERQNFESIAGRENILSFAFRRRAE